MTRKLDKRKTDTDTSEHLYQSLYQQNKDNNNLSRKLKYYNHKSTYFSKCQERKLVWGNENTGRHNDIGILKNTTKLCVIMFRKKFQVTIL